MKFDCRFCQTIIVIQGLQSSFLCRNPSCLSSLSLFEGQGGCTQCDPVEGFRSLPHISGYFFIFSLRFPQNTRLHFVYSNRFPPSRQKRSNDGNRYHPTQRPCVMLVIYDVYTMYDIIEFENLRFRPSTCKQEPSVFKNFHSGERFWKDAFSVIVFTGDVWTVGQTKGKYLRFQTKTDTYGLTGRPSKTQCVLQTGACLSSALPVPSSSFHVTKTQITSCPCRRHSATTNRLQP